MNETMKPLALIVGGSSGMGMATARLLLQRGTDVIIVGKSPEKLESAQQALSEFGNVKAIQTNLYDSDQVSD